MTQFRSSGEDAAISNEPQIQDSGKCSYDSKQCHSLVEALTGLEEAPRKWNRQRQHQRRIRGFSRDEKSCLRDVFKKEDIGHPENFVWLQHVAWDKGRGFSYYKRDVIEANTDFFYTSAGVKKNEAVYTCDKGKLLTSSFAEIPSLENTANQHNHIKSEASPSSLQKWPSFPSLKIEPPSERITKSRKRPQLRKQDIGQPSNFRHVQHVGTSDPFQHCIDLDASEEISSGANVEHENASSATPSSINYNERACSKSQVDKTGFHLNYSDELPSSSSSPLASQRPKPQQTALPPPPALEAPYSLHKSYHSCESSGQDSDKDFYTSLPCIISSPEYYILPLHSPTNQACRAALDQTSFDTLDSSPPQTSAPDSPVSFLPSVTEKVVTNPIECGNSLQQAFEPSVLTETEYFCPSNKYETCSLLPQPTPRKSILKLELDATSDCKEIKDEKCKEVENFESKLQEYATPWYDVFESSDVAEL